MTLERTLIYCLYYKRKVKQQMFRSFNLYVLNSYSQLWDCQLFGNPLFYVKLSKNNYKKRRNVIQVIDYQTFKTIKKRFYNVT